MVLGPPLRIVQNTQLTSQLGTSRYVSTKYTREVVNKRMWIYESHIFDLRGKV